MLGWDGYVISYASVCIKVVLHSKTNLHSLVFPLSGAREKHSITLSHRAESKKIVWKGICFDRKMYTLGGEA